MQLQTVFNCLHFRKTNPGSSAKPQSTPPDLAQRKVILSSFSIIIFAISFKLRYVMNFNIFQLRKQKFLLRIIQIANQNTKQLVSRQNPRLFRLPFLFDPVLFAKNVNKMKPSIMNFGIFQLRKQKFLPIIIQIANQNTKQLVFRHPVCLDCRFNSTKSFLRKM